MIKKYVLIFIALAIFGSMADVPIFFLGVRGVIALSFVVIVSFFMDIVSDLIWYFLGKKIGVERFEKLKYFRQKPERMETISKALDKYGMWMLFFSKFIFLFGIPTQIVAGAHKYPLKKMLLANSLGAAATIIVILGFARVFASELLVEKYLKNVHLAFLVFIGAIVLLQFLINKPLKKFLDR